MPGGAKKKKEEGPNFEWGGMPGILSWFGSPPLLLCLRRAAPPTPHSKLVLFLFSVFFFKLHPLQIWYLFYLYPHSNCYLFFKPPLFFFSLASHQLLLSTAFRPRGGGLKKKKFRLSMTKRKHKLLVGVGLKKKVPPWIRGGLLKKKKSTNFEWGWCLKKKDPNLKWRGAWAAKKAYQL